MRASQRAAHGAALLLVLSLPAAACPTAADLEAGVTFVADGGQLDHQTQIGANVIAVQSVNEIGSSERTNSARSVHSVYVLTAESEGLDQKYTWTDGVEALAYPRLGLAAEYPVRASFESYDIPGLFSIRVGDTAGAIRLSGCQLEMWEVLTEFNFGGGRRFGTGYQWFPALGTGVPVVWTRNGIPTQWTKFVEMNW
ncbi:MAG: hypothetical protein AAFP28_03755 [Pseudomonadota bacterium]